jgi:ATP-binding cassette subfamily F protein 3
MRAWRRIGITIGRMGVPLPQVASSLRRSRYLDAVLSLEKVTVSFGTRRVLDSVDWMLGTGERVALVGRNGAGKTTLFRVALGLQEPDDGVVRKAHHVRVGYLPQEATPLSGETVLDGALAAFDVAIDAAREQEELQQEIEQIDPEDPELPALVRRLDELHHVFAHADGFRMRTEAERVLDGLGFSAKQMASPLATLSGGWRMRVLLAKLLLSRPTHLFLDEPTNHLDLPSLAWLEDFLKSFTGTLVVISHDRAFLDGMVTKVVELRDGGIELYSGNYTAYEVEKERRKAALVAAKEQQDQKIAQLERFVERFRAKNSKAAQAKSKEKILEKIERIEIERESASIRFRFAPSPRSGQVVLSLTGVNKRFGAEPPLFTNLDLEIERGDKVAVVGPNGAGKSTLLRILAGTERVDGGARKLDGKALMAFFAQHTAEALDLDKCVFDEVRKVAPRTLTDTQVRSLLGSFLFTGDEIDKRIAILSGGEKARVALARTLVQPLNLLLLDEPTNHLDLQGKETLARALADYDGTLVIVTHDRHLIDKVATRVLEVNPGGMVRTYLGGFTQYAEMRLRENRPLPGYAPKVAAKSAPAKVAALARAPTAERDAGEPAKKPGEARRDQRREERRAAQEQERIVARLEQLEAEKLELERRFELPELYQDAPRLAEAQRRHAKVADEIAALWQKMG